MIRAEDDTRTLEGWDPSFGPSGGYRPGSFQGGPDMNAGRDAIAQAMLAQQGMQPPQQQVSFEGPRGSGDPRLGGYIPPQGSGGGGGGGGAYPLGSFQGGPDMNDPANAHLAAGNFTYGQLNPFVGSSLSGGMAPGTSAFGGMGPGNASFGAAAAAAANSGSGMFGAGNATQGGFNTGETGRGAAFSGTPGSVTSPSIGNFGASFSGPNSFATANNTPGATITAPNESFAGRWGDMPSNTLPDPNDPAIHGMPAQTARSAPTAPPGSWPSGRSFQQGPDVTDPGDQAAMAASAQGFEGGVGGYAFGSGFNAPGGFSGGGGWGGFDPGTGFSGHGGFESGGFGAEGVG